jgi:hypothetical protein
MKKIFTCILILVGYYVSAQDPQFSQFGANPLYLNPASTGEVDGWRMGANYRNQWLRAPGKTFPGPLSTYNAWADFQLRNLVVGGLGFNLMQDMEGEGRLKYTTAGLFYSWHTPTGSENFNLFFGTRLSYNFLTIDYSRLTFSDQLDPELGPVLPTMFQPGQQGNVQYFDIDMDRLGVFFREKDALGNAGELVIEIIDKQDFQKVRIKSPQGLGGRHQEALEIVGKQPGANRQTHRGVPPRLRQTVGVCGNGNKLLLQGIKLHKSRRGRSAHGIRHPHLRFVNYGIGPTFPAFPYLLQGREGKPVTEF